MKKFTLIKHVALTAIFYVIAVSGIVLLVNSCNKSKQQSSSVPANETSVAVANNAAAPVIQNNSLIQIVTIGDIRKSDDGISTRIIFNENEEIFTVKDQSVLEKLQEAYNGKKTIKVTFNPWSATVLNVNNPTDQEVENHRSRPIINSPGLYQRVDLATMNPDVLNNAPALAVLNSSTPGLTNVIPDMATAQLMFDYITKQCCQLGGPYAIDHCIPFQYVADGCYARAHKMCWILNNRYNYATHKIFSFAVGGYSLSVKAEKWCGHCINWWYHVAPLVSINTPTGVKAFVFDPSMFDQPVLLATWLHAQENPVCSGVARVTSFNLQPTASYGPAAYADTTTFDTDPTYSSTNSTLISYSALHTCP